jgi:YVTN family beta-propeller protein
MFTTLPHRPSRASMPFLLTFAALCCAATADAATLLVANKAEATVFLYSLPAGEIVAKLPTGQGPHEIAVSPSGDQALITNYGGQQPGSTLTLVDIPGARVVKTIDLGAHRRPHGVEWLDESRALVTAEGSQALLVVDVAAGKVLSAIATGQEISHMVALLPDRSRAFVANIGSGSINAIDLASGKSVAVVPTGAGAEGIAVTPDGTQVWVTNRDGDFVSVLDARTHALLGTVPSASFPIRAKVTPDGKWVLVSNAASGDVSVISAAGRKLERKLTFGLEAAPVEGRLLGGFGTSSVPIGIVVDPAGTRAWVAHANADRVAIVDLATWKVVGTLTTGKEPDGMAYSAIDVRPAAPATAPPAPAATPRSGG